MNTRNYGGNLNLVSKDTKHYSTAQEIIFLKRILFQILSFFNSAKRKGVPATCLRIFMPLCLCLTLLTACAPKINFQIERPPIQRIEKIKYIEVGNFQIISGQIKLPKAVESESYGSFLGAKKPLEPTISGFTSNKEQSPQIANIVRAALVHDLSLHSPFQLINTTGEKTGYSGALPDAEEVGILIGKVKYSQVLIESQEALSYFTNIKNKGANLEQSLLASAISMGAESSGVGFKFPTPYVEQLAAIEVEFYLLRKSDGRDVVPPQTFRACYARKWGGDPETSHLPRNIKTAIVKSYQQDEDLSESFLSRVDREGLSFTNPTEYFARGFNLEQNIQVPQTPLDLKIRLGRQVAQKYVEQISPYHEAANLLVQDGDSVAATLIRGNAYLEAISYLQGLDERTEEDEYNLGLAFEAGGEILQAAKHYELALQQETSNQIFKDAVKRTRN